MQISFSSVHSCFVFGRFWVKISARTTVSLSEFHVVFVSLFKHEGYCHVCDQDGFLPHAFQFIISPSFYLATLLKASLNKQQIINKCTEADAVFVLRRCSGHSFLTLNTQEEPMQFDSLVVILI
jgi:hypothetical protein